MSCPSLRATTATGCEYRLTGYNIEPYSLEAPGEDTIYDESVHGFKSMEVPTLVHFHVHRIYVASSELRARMPFYK